MTAELVVVKGKDRGTVLPIKPEGVHTIGRSEGQDLRLKGDKKVSTAHARITGQGGDRYLLEDLGSTNGTFVNGERIQASPLRTGDRVKIGHSLMVFKTDAGSVHLSDLGDSDSDDKDPETSTKAPAHAAAAKSSAGKSSASKGKSGASLKKSVSGKSAALARDENILQLGEALAEAKDLRGQLDKLIRIALQATAAGRAILFVRDPDGGALTVVTAISREGAKEKNPADQDVLREAVSGKLAGPAGDGMAVAAPLKVGERTLGALYLDDPDGRTPGPREAQILTSCANVIALALRADRLEHLAESAVEVVSLAQTPPNRVVVDLVPLVEAAARLYAPVAEARGIKFDSRLPASLRVTGDETLIARALDRLIESVLVSAKATLKLEVRESGKIASVLVSRGGTPLPDALSDELGASTGPAGDLKGALARLSDGGLALVRAAVARSGGRFTIEPGVPDMLGKSGTEKMGPAPAATYVLELPLAT